MLDNPDHLSRGIPHNPPIPARVLKHRSKDRRRPPMPTNQPKKDLRGQQGSIPRNHQHRINPTQNPSLNHLPQSMASPPLLCLSNTNQALKPSGESLCPHLLRLVSNHDHNTLERKRPQSLQNPPQQRTPANLMQHLGSTRKKASPPTGSKNDSPNRHRPKPRRVTARPAWLRVGRRSTENLGGRVGQRSSGERRPTPRTKTPLSDTRSAGRGGIEPPTSTPKDDVMPFHHLPLTPPPTAVQQ